jgi:hypothetical protein
MTNIGFVIDCVMAARAMIDDRFVCIHEEERRKALLKRWMPLHCRPGDLPLFDVKVSSFRVKCDLFNFVTSFLFLY